ncbi:MAG TPA: acyl-CoA dehydrogenase family protein [Candidatus Acidoferrales bacterium]|nr:acyl-CoA dehydrogenase family protein [Candidatus Acidoferrales bacterium]
MDLNFTSEQQDFRRRLRRWLKENLPAAWANDGSAVFASYEDEVAVLRDWQSRLHRDGWCGLAWPKEYGGGGATFVEQAIFNEEVARAQAPELIGKVGINNVGPTLIAHGSEEQKRRYLPKILSAEEIWCQLFSEPDAGSDLAGLKTRAEVDGDGYRLTGQKAWTSYAQHSRWGICLARTNPDVPKHKGLTYFIVDMHAAGVDIRPIRQITGTSEFNDVFLDAVFVPRDQVIGKENDGWAVAMNTLAHERGTGFLFKEQVKEKIAIDRLIAQLRRRQTQGLPTHPSFRQELANAYIRVEILRLLNLDTMTRLSRGAAAGAETSAKKEFRTSLTQHLHATALAMQGPASQLVDGHRAIDRGGWQHSFLVSRYASIAGGTSEIQLNIIATQVLGLPRA